MYRSLYRYVLSRIDAELIHQWTLKGLQWSGRIPLTRALLRRTFAPGQSHPDLSLSIRTLNLNFAHPLGLAAGFDKNGCCLRAMNALGFSFTEIGTVTPYPQPGNPRPRLFRLPTDEALINSMGFPSAGLEAVERNLRRSGHYVYPLGLSLGKNKETPLNDAYQDYCAVLTRLYSHADFFVINISSPNTPELRKLQTPAYLDDLLTHVTTALHTLAQNPKPLLLKISPDLSLSDLDIVLALAQKHQISGIIATNTTTERRDLHDLRRDQAGGLSGRPLRQRSTDIVRYCYQQTRGKLCIIGVGGIFSGDDVWDKLCAGATLVQAYTGFIYEGPAFVRKVITRLRQKMDKEGVRTLQEIIGNG